MSIFDELIKLRQEGKEIDVVTVARKLGCSPKTIQNYLPKIKEVEEGEKKFKGFNYFYSKYCEIINKDYTSKRITGKRDLHKTLVISDTHNKYMNLEAFSRAINDNLDAQRCVIAGDLINLDAYSKFTPEPDNDRSSVVEDVVATEAMLAVLNDTFPEVIVIDSNHHWRPWKYLAQRMPPELIKYLDTDIVGNIIKQYPNITLHKKCYNFGNAGEINIGFFYKLGKDCLIGHFETSSKTPMKPLTNIAGWVKSWDSVFGEFKDVKLILNGHNHRAGKIYERGIMLGAIPSLCQIMPYILNSDVKYGPPILGYWVVYQDDKGYTDINKSNFVIL